IVILVWAIVIFKGEGKALGTVSKQGLFFLIISGIATGVSWLFYFNALEVGEVSKRAAVDHLTVALVTTLAVISLNERTCLKTGIGAGLIILGTIIMVAKF